MLVGRSLDLLGVLAWFIVLREELLILDHKILYLLVCISLNPIVLSQLDVLEVLDSTYKLLFAQVGSFQDGVLLGLKVLWIGLGHALVSQNEVAYREDNVFLDVFYQRIDEWRPNISDPVLDPSVVMKVVPLARQDTEVDREVVILAIHDTDEAVLDFLGDVEDPGEVHQSLVMLAELTECSHKEILVVVEELGQHNGRVGVITEEHWHNNRQDLVQHDNAAGRLGQAQGEEEILGKLLDRMIKNLAHLHEHASVVRQDHQSFDQLDGLPHFNHFGGFASILDLLEIVDSGDSGLELGELDTLVLLANVGRNTVLDERQLQAGTLPRLTEEVREREGDVLRLALVEQLKECLELL